MRVILVHEWRHTLNGEGVKDFMNGVHKTVTDRSLFTSLWFNAKVIKITKWEHRRQFLLTGYVRKNIKYIFDLNKRGKEDVG